MAAEYNTPEVRAAQRQAIRNLRTEANTGYKAVNVTGTRALELADLFGVNIAAADRTKLGESEGHLTWFRDNVEKSSRPGIMRTEIARVVRALLA